MKECEFCGYISKIGLYKVAVAKWEAHICLRCFKDLAVVVGMGGIK